MIDTTIEKRIPEEFDYNDNIERARREQAKAVHSAVQALVTRVGRLFGA